MADYSTSSIVRPSGNDILCGRGGGTNAHPGNIKFRKLVAAHKLRYLAASKSDKPGVARDVVREWRAMDPPGRFLAKMDGKNIRNPDDEAPVLWYDVGDKKAREKASQCLRERNGAANEAVAALVKTVTASGEACPEDYATLMNKAAMVKAQNDLTIQQQNEMIKMGRHQSMHQQQQNMRNDGGGRMGGGGQYCQDIEPMSYGQHQGGYNQGGDNYGGGNQSSEDELIEAEIQRLLHQRQQQMNGGGSQGNNYGGGGGMMGGNLDGSGRNLDGSDRGGRAGIPNGMQQQRQQQDHSGNAPQPYMGEESVMKEYQQLMQKQRELNMMAGKMDGGFGMDNMDNGMGNGMGNNGMGGMMGGMDNTGMGGMMNNNMGGMNNMSGGMGGMMPQGAMSNNNMGMNNSGGMENNNYGGGGGGNMQSNHNPDAAKDYMNRLRMLRQGGGGGGNIMPDQAASNSGYNNGYSGNGGNMGNSSSTMNNMGNMQGNSGMGGSSGRGPEEFTIEEYQASLQQFLSHNDENSARPDHMTSREASQRTQHASNMSSQQQYNGNATSGTIQCIQVPTNLGDGSNKRNRRGSLRSVDDMDLPIGRNTFKSVDSGDRPSFQSMDDMDIRGTFRSVDTMDMMSIGNSINEIMDDDVKQNPEAFKKYAARLSAAKGGNNPSLNDFARHPGETLEIKTMDHGKGSKGGPRKIKKGIDPRLPSQAGTRHSVQTKDRDGPGAGTRGSQLSIKDFNLDGADDASRMSFGNMSIMSDMTDFQGMLAKGDADSYNQL